MTLHYPHIWIPEFEVDHEQVLGQSWPLVLVSKWEVNRMGERRFVGTRSYAESLTVEKLAAAIHEASIHMVHGDPEAQARRVLNVLAGREWHEDA